MSLMVGIGFVLSFLRAPFSRRMELAVAGLDNVCRRETPWVVACVASPEPRISGLERLERSSLGVWCELEHSLVFPSSSERLPSELRVEMD